jgi:hypothetical protein
METQTPIDSSISPSVDPMMADALADQFNLSVNADGQPVRHPAFTSGRAVLATLFSTSTVLSEAERNIRAAGLNDPVTRDRLQRSATAKMNAARKSGAEGLAALQSHVDQINAGIDESLGLPAARNSLTDAGRCSDVRAYLRSLSSRERPEAIRKAIADGDMDVAAAVLSASPYASGITRKEAEGVRMDAEERFCKPAVRMRENIGRMVSLVETAMNATEQRFGPLCGVGDSKAARAARSLAALEGGQ